MGREADPVKRILVADDEAAVREGLSDLFTRDGYAVVVAPDGLAVLERLRETGIDLLVLDINRPGLGGASLVHLLRTDPAWQPFARLPIIVVSALWGAVTFRLDIQAGFPKPIPYARLQETDRKSTRLNSSHIQKSRMPSSA